MHLPERVFHHVVWHSLPFTKCCAGERVWNHAIHRVVTRSSIPGMREYHYALTGLLANWCWFASILPSKDSQVALIDCAGGGNEN